jgi:hypothetical protein
MSTIYTAESIPAPVHTNNPHRPATDEDHATTEES